MDESNEASNVIRAAGKDVHASELEWQQYRKLPVVITATRMDVPFTVHTLEGLMGGLPGDWLIEGVAGELYPCRDDIFRQTYELVTEKEAA